MKNSKILLDENGKIKNFDEFYKAGRRNRIFIRAAKANLDKLTKEQKTVVKREIEKSKIGLKTIYDVQKEIQAQGYRLVLFKTLNNYPDFGFDADVLVEKDLDKITKHLMKEFNGKKVPSSLAMHVSRKTSFSIPGSPVVIEMHVNKFSQVWERTIPGSQLIDRSIVKKIDNMEFIVPSLEDTLLIEVIHRIYRHLNIRSSNLYNMNNLLKTQVLDWEYILSMSKKYGLMPGLMLFLKMTKEYGSDINNLMTFPRNISPGQFLYQHTTRIVNDTIRLRPDSALRLATIYPFLLTLRFVMAKLFDKGNLIW